MPVDLSSWLTKRVTAARLGISERTLDRRCDAGTGPERRPRPRTGLKPEPVYNPDDVERLAAPKAHVMSEPPPGFGEPTPQERSAALATLTTRPSSSDLVPALLDRVAGAVEWWMAESRPPAPTLYLTIPQASAYSGLSMALLWRLVREGKLAAIRDRSVKVRRTDLDAGEMLAELSKCASPENPCRPSKPTSGVADAPSPSGNDEEYPHA